MSGELKNVNCDVEPCSLIVKPKFLCGAIVLALQLGQKHPCQIFYSASSTVIGGEFGAVAHISRVQLQSSKF